MSRRHLAALAVAAASCGPPRAAPTPPQRAPALDAAPADAGPGDESGAGITPRAYQLELAIDPAATGYTGTVSIDVDVAVRASAIWLDAVDLRIDWARLSIGDDVLELALIADPPLGRLGLELPRPLDPGVARLDVAFGGDYAHDDAIFAQTYRAATYVFSDFEPIDARRGFPCFDEPRWKTPWTVSLIVPDGQLALSNTAALHTDDLTGPLTRVDFAPTPPLPSYLVALAVGPFDVVEAVGGPRPVRIIVPTGRAAAAARAAAFAPELLEEARAFLDRAVPFDKLDVIAVPYFSGAMENPGLVTVAEEILLGSGGEREDRRLALVLAHEIAHLWFGDSVTLADWRDLWINEGVATWMADEVLARWRPSWDTRTGEIAARLEAMAEDEAPGAHPLRPEELTGPRVLFDILTYQKAAAVLHMVEDWVGADRFVEAMRGYLDAHAGGSAVGVDLIAALAPLDADVAAVMAPLVEQAGVPVVDALLTCDASGARLGLAQQAGPAVPACVRWRDGTAVQRACVLVDGFAELDLGAACPTWVHPNADGSGYYRWLLRGDATLAAAIAGAGATDRERLEAALAIRTAIAGATPLREIAGALAAAIKTGLPDVVTSAIADYKLLLEQAAPARAGKAIAAHLRKALAPAVKRLGTAPRAGDDDDDRRLRPIVLAAAGGLAGDKKVIAWARKATRRWLTRQEVPAAPELLEPALLVAAAHPDGQLVEALVTAAAGVMDATATGPADAPLYGRALGRLPADQALATLGDALDGSVPSMITFTLAVELLSRRDTGDDTADLLALHGDWLAIALTFAPICDPEMYTRVNEADTLARRRADAERCAALTPRLEGAARAFE